MTTTCTIQLYSDRVWHDVGSVRLLGAESTGWRAKTYCGYGVEWALAHSGARDAHALCSQWPVSLEPWEREHWPVFLIDMLPQGFGRQELLRRLSQPPTAGASADWPLLLSGAGNPIGNLRIKEAAEWLSANAGERAGFSDEEVAQRCDEFSEYLASHGLFVAGSSGIQGVWPKVLLTRSTDGLLYLDHTLPDEAAVEHYIVKFGRGTDRQLAAILRNEAPYMALAAHLGLRVNAPLVLRDRALFIPRFDRRVEDGHVIRLAQESIATLTGVAGFEAAPSHDTVCRELIRRCSKPQDEVLEYIKRDMVNLAFGNKDNHARNTALQRDFDGHIALTPLYDFAPMYLHPDGIARRIRWEGNDAGQPDWGRVLDRVSELAAQVWQEERRRGPNPLQRAALVAGLKAMVPRLQTVAEVAAAYRLEPEVYAYVRPGIEARVNELIALT
jgi:serine/threonine-protein kinase HipA